MLELDLATILWQTFNFLIFAGALYFLLFKPVSAGMKKRAAEKAQLMQDLKADQEATAALRVDLEARLECTEEEAAHLITEAKNQAERERAALLAEAQAEVERILTASQVDAYRLKKQAVDEFNDDLLRAIADVSGLVIGRVSPAPVQDAMVKQLFDSVWELGRNDMQRVDELRRSLGDRTPTVVVRTAKSLTGEQQGQLVRTCTALADRNINLDLRVDPAMGLGLRVRIGDLVIDNSIAGKFEDLQDEVLEALRERLTNE